MNIIPAFIRRRIQHRPNLVKIVDNIGWLFLDKVLRMGVGLLVGVWIARYLGPEQFGLLNFALAFTGLFGALAGMGLQSIVVRDIVRDPSGANLTLGTAAVLQIVGGLLSFLIILGAIAWVRPDDPLARSIVAIMGAMMLFKASEIAVYWFESQVQSKYTVWVQNGVFLLFAAVKVALILSQAPLTAFVWVMLAEVVLVAVILLLVMGRYGPALSGLRASWLRAKTLLKDSWPLMLSGVAITIYMKTDQIMLGQMLGDEAVGIYSVALRISEIWYFIPMVIVASLFPAILNAKQQSEALYYQRLQNLFSIMVWLAIAIAVPMTFLSTFVVTLLFGQAFAEAGPVLAIHIWTAVFVFLGVAGSRWYVTENLQSKQLVIIVSGAILNVALNYILIPAYGVIGAAISTLIAQASSAFLFDAFFPTTRRIFFMKCISPKPPVFQKLHF
ncbi:MAG: flippase [Methylomonas sp.]|nr:flippase [Methylomonas sp.]PPD20166.1 MAG: O-unit flippase [Methylomonas sp.]PPD25358.1 MAG: O-unit flippase [Methylomonas sp.]PPD35375.1 MAG: O-unit flippase [Methylomonas sp.]PPD38343.1 MAG: O-unit flippase [Methylomonas sp.]